VFRQDVKLPQLIETLAQLRLGEAWGRSPSRHVMYRFEDISRQLPFGCEFLKLHKVLSELVNLASGSKNSRFPLNSIPVSLDCESEQEENPELLRRMHC
jgi:hypothetical protein